MSETTIPEPGQVWVDNDPRAAGRRTVQVRAVEDGKVVIATLTGWDGTVLTEPRVTRVRLDRFTDKRSGYTLREDASR